MIECSNIEVYIKNRLLFEGNAKFYEGRLTVIKGNSGSGKTTLLNILSGHDNRYQKYISYINENGEKYKIDYNDIGFVFQDSSMLEDLTIKQNLEFFRQTSSNERIFTMEECLEMVHLDISLDKYVYEISGGQRQRLAIAACLYKNVHYLFLDEPTAYLDNANSEDIIDLLYKVTHELGIVTVVASHDRRFKDKCDVLYEIKDYQIMLLKDNLIEVKPNINTIECKEKKNPIAYYAKNSFINRIKKEIGLSIFTSIIISFVALFLGYIYLFTDLEDQQLSSLTNNELKLSLFEELNIDNYNSNYEHKIDDNTILALKSIEKINDIYPFYEFNASINGNEILVHSYYNNDSFNSYISSELSNVTNCTIENKANDTDGYIYFSSPLKELANERLEVYINLLTNNNKIYPIKVELSCNKLLDKTYQNQYSDNGEHIIYVPVHFINKLYKILLENTQSNNIRYNSPLFLISYNSTKDINSIIETVNNINKDLCCFSEVELNGLLLLGNKMTRIKESTFYLLIIVVLVLSTYYRVSLFISRLPQAALIRANGMNSFQTILCLISSNLIFDICSFILIMLVLTIGNSLLNTLSVDIMCRQVEVVLFILMSRLGIEFIIEYIYLGAKSVQSIMRD